MASTIYIALTALILPGGLVKQPGEQVTEEECGNTLGYLTGAGAIANADSNPTIVPPGSFGEQADLAAKDALIASLQTQLEAATAQSGEAAAKDQQIADLKTAADALKARNDELATIVESLTSDERAAVDARLAAAAAPAAGGKKGT